MGNVVQVDGRLMVIEYSDLPDDQAKRRNADGSLAIWAGSIAVHVIDLQLLQRLAGTADGAAVPRGAKKVAYIDAAGKPVEPGEPNAVKFERFIFDLMPQARRAIVVEVDRHEAFAPLEEPERSPRRHAGDGPGAIVRVAPPVASSGGCRSGRGRPGGDQPAAGTGCGRVGGQNSTWHTDRRAHVFRASALPEIAKKCHWGGPPPCATIGRHTRNHRRA